MASATTQYYNGDGRDGALNVTSSTNITYSGDTTVDASSSSGQKVLNVTATTGFSTGDMIMIYRIDTGVYEVHIVDTVQAGVSLTLVDNLVATWAPSSKYVLRMPQYTTVAISVSQTLSTDHGSMLLAFACSGAISGLGNISMGGKGYAGGAGTPWQSLAGTVATAGSGPGGGGAGQTGYGGYDYSAGGGAGKNGTGGNGTGYAGLTPGAGGSSYSGFRPGSGGGGGGANQGSHIPGASGGTGGGCIYVRAGSVNMPSGGGFQCQGTSGGNAGGQAGGGGGGSAGEIYLLTGEMTLSSTGVFYAPGGVGGAQSSSAIGGGGTTGHTNIDCVSTNYVPTGATMEYLDGYYDVGLRIREEGETVIPLCETVTASHALRIYDGSTTYGIALVATSDDSALNTRIDDGVSIKALKKQIL